MQQPTRPSQISEHAERTLEPPTVLPWADLELDSLPDLVASKMVALVERGAPPGLPGHLYSLSGWADERTGLLAALG